jgi:hypothetical protein
MHLQEPNFKNLPISKQNDNALKHKSVHEIIKKIKTTIITCCVTTLALGLRPRPGLAKVRANSEARESRLTLSGM